MARAHRMEVPLADWPTEGRKRWTDANRSGADPFDDCGPAAHLAGDQPSSTARKLWAIVLSRPNETRSACSQT